MRLTHHNNYDIENVVFNIFKIREPVFHNFKLNEMFNYDIESKGFVFDYFIKRIIYTTEILSFMETIGKAVEQTRLLGCEFESVVYYIFLN